MSFRKGCCSFCSVVLIPGHLTHEASPRPLFCFALSHSRLTLKFTCREILHLIDWLIVVPWLGIEPGPRCWVHFNLYSPVGCFMNYYARVVPWKCDFEKYFRNVIFLLWNNHIWREWVSRLILCFQIVEAPQWHGLLICSFGAGCGWFFKQPSWGVMDIREMHVFNVSSWWVSSNGCSFHTECASRRV